MEACGWCRGVAACLMGSMVHYWDTRYSELQSLSIERTLIHYWTALLLLPHCDLNLKDNLFEREHVHFK